MTITDRLLNVPGELAAKAPCLVATTGNITLAGLQTIDGVTLAERQRVLVWQQTDAKQNGIYTASTGPWLRPNDANRNEAFIKGTTVWVTSGAVNIGNEYIVTCDDDPIVVGTSLLTWAVTKRSAETAGDVQNFLTLANAAANVIPPEISLIRVMRSAVDSPLAPVYYKPGGPTGPLAFQDAGGNWWEADISGARQEICSPLTIYGSPTGSTANSGFDEASPWPAQYAIDFACDKIVINDVRVKVRLLAGNYGPLSLRSYVGSVNVDPGSVVSGVPGDVFTVPWLCGDPNNVEAVKVDGGGAFGVVGVACPTPWFITDMRISGNSTTPGSADAVLADYGTVFYIGNVRFGVGGQGLRAIWESQIEILRSMTVGFYPGCSIGARCARGGQVLAQLPNGPSVQFLDASGNVATSNPGPNYAGAFAYCEDRGSVIDLTGVADWAGTPTGVAAAEFEGGHVVSPELLPFGNLPVIYYQADGFASEGAGGIIPASTWTKVTWGNNSRNDGGWNRSGFPTNAYAPLKAGWYVFTLQLELSAITDGKSLTVALYRNGALLRSADATPGATQQVGATLTAMIFLDGVTQYIEAYVFQTDPGPQSLTGSVVTTQFFAYRL